MIIDGQSVPVLRDTDSQQVTVPADLAAGVHSYDALYGELAGVDHTLDLTSTEITEEIPDPNDPNAPPTINILGYDIDIALTLDATEVANIAGQPLLLISSSFAETRYGGMTVRDAFPDERVATMVEAASRGDRLAFPSGLLPAE